MHNPKKRDPIGGSRFTKILSFWVVRVAFVEQSIFVVEKRLIYEKTSIFNRKYDGIKIEVNHLSIKRFN